MNDFNKKTLIFIPARMGVRPQERVNLNKINGRTLLQQTLKFAENFSDLGKIFISSNDLRIVKKFKNYSHNYLRPKKLSSSGSNIVESILDGLNFLKNLGYMFKNVILLPPTSPLRKKTDLKKALKKFKKQNIDALVSVVAMRENPYLCIKKSNGKWNFLQNKRNKSTFSQKKFFFIDRNFCIAKTRFLKKYRNFLIKNKTKFYNQKRYITVDLNEFRNEDYKIAQDFLRKKNI